MIWAFIRTIPGKLWGYVALAAGIVAAYFANRAAIIRKERINQRLEDLKNAEATRKRIDATKPAGSAADARKRLQSRKSK